MASFATLEIDRAYVITDPITGDAITEGIQGADAMAEAWPEGAEAWPWGTDFDGSPEEVAK